MASIIQHSVSIKDPVVTSTSNYILSTNKKEQQPYETEVTSAAANLNNTTTVITLIAGNYLFCWCYYDNDQNI